MDRRMHTWMACGCGLLLSLTTAGCKSTHSKVPPGRTYSNDGRVAPQIGFSSEPHPANNAGNPALGVAPLNPNGMPNLPGSTQPTYGTPPPGAGNVLGAPSAGAYGGPGTSGAVPGTVPVAPANPALTNPIIPDASTTTP